MKKVMPFVMVAKVSSLYMVGLKFNGPVNTGSGSGSEFIVHEYRTGKSLVNCILMKLDRQPPIGNEDPDQPVSLGGSVGCAFRLETRRSRAQLPLRSATFFRGD